MKRPAIDDANDAKKKEGNKTTTRKTFVRSNRSSAGTGFNLLGSILGDIKQQRQAKSSSQNEKIDRELLKTQAEKALEKRKVFEREVREVLKKNVLEKWAELDGAQTVEFSFTLMQKRFRNIVHECCSEMRVISESVEVDEVDEDGDFAKYVKAYKLSNEAEQERKRSEILMKEKAEKQKREIMQFRKKESLTDKAPELGKNVEGLRVARDQEKRDKRSVEETIADMRQKKNDNNNNNNNTNNTNNNTNNTNTNNI
jgi:hypothetical protein